MGKSKLLKFDCCSTERTQNLRQKIENTKNNPKDNKRLKVQKLAGQRILDSSVPEPLWHPYKIELEESFFGTEKYFNRIPRVRKFKK